MGSLSSPHLEHLGLTGLRVRVLVAALLVVMLALPLGPDFGRSPLELAAALATFSWRGGRKGRSQRAAPSKRLPASEASSVDASVCKLRKQSDTQPRRVEAEGSFSPDCRVGATPRAKLPAVAAGGEPLTAQRTVPPQARHRKTIFKHPPLPLFHH